MISSRFELGPEWDVISHGVTGLKILPEISLPFLCHVETDSQYFVGNWLNDPLDNLPLKPSYGAGPVLGSSNRSLIAIAPEERVA